MVTPLIQHRMAQKDWQCSGKRITRHNVGITLGDVGYQGAFEILEVDWDKLKDKEWKYKK